MRCDRTRFLFFRALLALLLATAATGGAAEHAAKAVTAEHPAAAALRAALENGSAFQMSFAVLPPAADAAAKDRQERAVSRALRRLRSGIQAQAVLALRRVLGIPYPDGVVALHRRRIVPPVRVPVARAI